MKSSDGSSLARYSAGSLLVKASPKPTRWRCHARLLFPCASRALAIGTHLRPDTEVWLRTPFGICFDKCIADRTWISRHR
jgi:hypothetical protein